MSIRVKPEDLAKRIASDIKKNKKAVDQGLERAAHRGRTHLVKRTPVDTGHMKNAWRVKGKTIHNDAPHAGIIEGGARPHKVNREGIEALTGWARRVLGVPDDQARSVAFAIAKKIEKNGQEGKWIVRDSLDDLLRFAEIEVERALRRKK